MAVHIPQYRLLRLHGKEADLNMLMYIDSYHDFKGLRGKIGDQSCVPFIDAYMIQNNIVSGKTGKPPRTAVLDFFADKGIQYSKIEQSSRLYFEKAYPKTIHGTSEYGTTPTVITYTDITKIKSMKADVIRMELDSAFQTAMYKGKHIGASYASVAERFLDWMFPEAAQHTEVGISIDAKYALIDDLLMPLNDKRKKFYATHVVTPQNILDSAHTSFNVLPGTLNDSSSRIVYTNDLTDEYANVLTKDVGSFQIVNTDYGHNNKYGFQWQFVPTDGNPINIPVSQFQNSGPSVNFLANMAISCNNVDKGNKRAMCLMKIANIAKNANMVNPMPALQTLDKESFVKLCIDIKRLGDHEQANAVFMRNKLANCIFITGDTLSALYSRILGNPTIYVSTTGVDEEDDDSGSNSLLCYRGIPAIVTPEQSAKRRLEYAIDSLNYVITVYSQLASLASGTSFTTLKENIETYVDKYQYIAAGLSSDISMLYNLLIRWRVYDILAHIKDITTLFAHSSEEILAKLSEFETELQKTKGVFINCKKNGANIVVKSGDIARIHAAADAIEAALATISRQTEEANKYIKYFNNMKAFDVDGNTIFTFNYQLYFSDVKIAPSLAFLNFFMSDIDAISIQFIRLKSGKLLRSSTDEHIRNILYESFYSFVSKFYKTTDIEGELDILLPIQKILNDTSEFTAKPVINRLIESLSRLVQENIQSLKQYILAKHESYVGHATAATIAMTKLDAETDAIAANPVAPNTGKIIVKRRANVARNAAKKAIATTPSLVEIRRSSRLIGKVYRGGSSTVVTQTQTRPMNRILTLRAQTNVTRKNRTMPQLPDVRTIFSNVIDISIEMIHRYNDMFDIVTGDKALYTQYVKDGEPQTHEIQHGGEIVRSGPGIYESDYGFHNQFYAVVKTLIYTQNLYMEYKPVDTHSNATSERDVAENDSMKRLFDIMGQQWLALDSLITIKGPPDFSIEPAYPKHTYNDIRLHSAYQTIIHMFCDVYDPNRFAILCTNIQNVTLYNNDPHIMDILIDTLPTLLIRITDQIRVPVDADVKAASAQILLAKFDTIDYSIYAARHAFHQWKLSNRVKLRYRIAYHLRQIEELVKDSYVIDAENAYVNAVASWIAPKGPSSVSSTLYGDLIVGSIYYDMLEYEDNYATFAKLYADAISDLNRVSNVYIGGRFNTTRKNPRSST